MQNFQATPKQQEIIDAPLFGSFFIEGKAGCGKTTAALKRLESLLDKSRFGQEILVLLPSRTSNPLYAECISAKGERAAVMTFNSLVQRSIELFWQLTAEAAGFPQPQSVPTFMTIETSQVLMAGIIRRKMAEGAFSSLQVQASRIYNQVLIAFHKMAAAGLPFDTYAQRMKSSWTGDPALVTVFDHVQDCCLQFRALCMENNLLDYAIQLEMFRNHVLPTAAYQAWLKNNVRHLIFDNIEEDIPAAHQFVRTVAPSLETMLLIADHSGGFRSFMGGDTESAFRLKALCDAAVQFDESLVCSPPVQAMMHALEDPKKPLASLPANPQRAFSFQAFHQYPIMIKNAAADVAKLIHQQNVDPEEIVIIAPLVSDVLYTSLERELRTQNVTCYVHRPSRPLIHESEAKAFITLIELLHPEWESLPKRLDICEMLQSFIPELDPIRGQLLVTRGFELKTDAAARIAYFVLKPFEKMDDMTQARIPAGAQRGYEKLRNWLQRNRSAREAPDLTLIRFFHEILTQEGFAAFTGARENMNLAVKKVSESIRKYRTVLEKSQTLLLDWQEYFTLVNEGMVSASYYEDWYSQPQGTVLISLSSAFAIMNKPCRYQIWLNAGSPRWWERLYGQLTNDSVLSLNWRIGDQWDAKKIYLANNQNMNQLLLALLSRCREKVMIYASELNESGQDQKSRLLYVFADLAFRLNREQNLPVEPLPQLVLNEEAPTYYPGIDDNQSVSDAEEESAPGEQLEFPGIDEEKS